MKNIIRYCENNVLTDGGTGALAENAAVEGRLAVCVHAEDYSSDDEDQESTDGNHFDDCVWFLCLELEKFVYLARFFNVGTMETVVFTIFTATLYVQDDVYYIPDLVKQRRSCFFD